MNHESRIMNFYGIIPFIVLIIFDQLLKYLIRHFGGFYICNPNISWGLRIPESLFWFFWMTIMIILLIALKKKYFIQNTLCIVLILSGAVSNMIDRICYGCVVDFIDLKLWPVFNLADIFIVSGAILLLVRWKKI